MQEFSLISDSNKLKMRVPRGKSCIVVLLSSKDFLPFVADTIETKLRNKDLENFKDVPPELVEHKHFCAINFADKKSLGRSFSVMDHGEKLVFHFDVAVEVSPSNEEVWSDYVRIFGDRRPTYAMRFELCLDCVRSSNGLASRNVQ